jgi:hypothetical protein
VPEHNPQPAGFHNAVVDICNSLILFKHFNRSRQPAIQPVDTAVAAVRGVLDVARCLCRGHIVLILLIFNFLIFWP